MATNRLLSQDSNSFQKFKYWLWLYGSQPWRYSRNLLEYMEVWLNCCP